MIYVRLLCIFVSTIKDVWSKIPVCTRLIKVNMSLRVYQTISADGMYYN